MITEKKIIEILKDNSDVIDRSVNSESFRGVSRQILSLNSDSTAENKGQQKGMKWVKANECLPKKEGNYFLRHPYVDGRMHGWWSYIVPDAIDKEHWVKLEYEWLDESTTDKTEELQEEVERLRTALEKISATQLNSPTEAEGRFYDCIGVAEEALNQK